MEIVLEYKTKRWDREESNLQVNNSYSMSLCRDSNRVTHCNNNLKMQLFISVGLLYRQLHLFPPNCINQTGNVLATF